MSIAADKKADDGRRSPSVFPFLLQLILGCSATASISQQTGWQPSTLAVIRQTPEVRPVRTSASVWPWKIVRVCVAYRSVVVLKSPLSMAIISASPWMEQRTTGMSFTHGRPKLSFSQISTCTMLLPSASTTARSGTSSTYAGPPLVSRTSCATTRPPRKPSARSLPRPQGT